MSSLSAFGQSVGNALQQVFLAPVFLYFLWLIPIVILLYLLKLRRTRVVIASTLLWMKSLQDLTANAPFQRLRRNLLLLLQILILLLVAGALARPFVKAEGRAGRNLCMLIDRSASMQTVEGQQTRMDLAKSEALRMVDEMQKGDKLMLVTFAENTDVLCELTDDRARLRRAIQGISAADTRTRLRDAYLVAHSLRLTVAGLHAVVISDGGIADLDEIGPRNFGQVREVADTSTEARARGYDLSYLQVGATSDNAGIVAFSLREPEQGQPGEKQSFVLVHNASSEPLNTTVTLSFNDSTLAVEEIAVPAGEDGELVFAHPELGTGILKAELDHEDVLPVDNVAWLTLRPAAKLRVLLVAEPEVPGTYFLQRVLAPDPRVELSTLPPANYAPGHMADLTVFYNFAPTALPSGTLLFVNALPPMPGIGSEGSLDRPPVIATDSEHPLMRFNLNPGNVGISTALKLTLPEGARTVVSAPGAPLIADVSQGGQSIAVIAFDIAASDWPLNLSFPLFFQNLLAWVPRTALAEETSVEAGHPLTLVSRPETAEASVQVPAGQTEHVVLDPLRPVYFSDTQDAGLYTVTYGEGDTEQFAVNLLDRKESSVTPAPALSIGGGDFKAQRGHVRQTRELWRWFLGVGIAVLALEWWVFSRRAWI